MNKQDAQSSPLFSVVVPCHNPRRDYLEHVLCALRQQTLAHVKWELVVVDNASAPPLEKWVDLSWHPCGRLVREEKQGLAHARLRGLRESRGAWIVFVDDDNKLAPDYLRAALRIARERDFLGVFGGSIEPVFEQEPPGWTRPHWGKIAIRAVERSVWSNDVDHWESTPIGAGMVVRRDVLMHYARSADDNPLRLLLGRSGKSLASGEDLDLVMMACSMGFGKGRFKELKLDHLIPASRLTEDYLCRMYEGNGYSAVILYHLWNRTDPAADYQGTGNLLRMGWKRLVQDWRQRRMLKADKRGRSYAKRLIMDHESCRKRSSAGGV